MKKEIKINRKKLFKLYMKSVSKLCEACDWISTVTPEMVIGLVSDVIEENTELLYFKPKTRKKSCDCKFHKNQYCDVCQK
jgi:hypothetical protein